VLQITGIAYTAILNPYDSIYPETDLSENRTVSKILSYVREGGLFINVGDIPGYYVYNIPAKKILHAATPIYFMRPDGNLDYDRPFELTPLLKEVGLIIRKIEQTEITNEWEMVPQNKYLDKIPNIGKLRVHRAVIVEKNVESIVSKKELADKQYSPIFITDFGNGKFLFSLLFLNHEDNLRVPNLKNNFTKLITQLVVSETVN
jgi:hypothetical protein